MAQTDKHTTSSVGPVCLPTPEPLPVHAAQSTAATLLDSVLPPGYGVHQLNVCMDFFAFGLGIVLKPCAGFRSACCSSFRNHPWVLRA